MNLKIMHYAINTCNMKAMIDFYCDKLGFKHSFSLKDDQGNPWIEYLKLSEGQFLELFYLENEPDKGNIYNHICFEVPDCQAAADELEKRGVTLDVKPTRGKDGNLQAWIHDPDGNRIELMQVFPDSMSGRA